MRYSRTRRCNYWASRSLCPSFLLYSLHFPWIVRMRFFPRLPALSISHKIGSDATPCGVTIFDSEKNAARERLEIIVWRAPQSRVAAGDLLLEDALRTCSKFIIVLFVLGRGTIFLFLCLCARGKSRPTIHHSRAHLFCHITKVCLFCGSRAHTKFWKVCPWNTWANYGWAMRFARYIDSISQTGAHLQEWPPRYGSQAVAVKNDRLVLLEHIIAAAFP